MNGIEHPRQHPLSRRANLILAFIGVMVAAGCAAQTPTPSKTVYQSGLNQVRIEKDPASTTNAHPASLTATEVGTLLRGVRIWERRNPLHRLFVGQADKTSRNALGEALPARGANHRECSEQRPCRAETRQSEGHGIHDDSSVRFLKINDQSGRQMAKYTRLVVSKRSGR